MAASLGRGPTATGSRERPNADDVGAALDLAVEALQEICRLELAAMLPGEGLQDGGKLGRLGAEPVGTGIP